VSVARLPNAMSPSRKAALVLAGYAAALLAACVTVAIATTNLAALAVFVVGRTASSPALLATWAALAVLWILWAPLFALVFLLAAFISPHRSPRVAFLAATAAEAAVCAYAAFIWLNPFRLH
jgi:hypothetical protein